MIMIMLCIDLCQRVCGEQKKNWWAVLRMVSVATGLNMLQHLIIYKL